MQCASSTANTAIFFDRLSHTLHQQSCSTDSGEAKMSDGFPSLIAGYEITKIRQCHQQLTVTRKFDSNTNIFKMCGMFININEIKQCKERVIPCIVSSSISFLGPTTQHSIPTADHLATWSCIKVRSGLTTRQIWCLFGFS